MSTPHDDTIIRISRDEANSSHVDDLIKRQMSLRGDPGVTRHAGRQWYLQSWFVLGVVGLLGAVLSWAMLEPWFDDLAYVQGTVQGLDFESHNTTWADPSHASAPAVIGRLTINGESLVVLNNTRELLPDGKVQPINGSTLANGHLAGCYVAARNMDHEHFGVVAFVVKDPPPASATPSLEVQQRRNNIAGLLLFSIVGGIIGLFIGAADGLICHLPRRALLSGIIGLIVGIVGGLISGVLAGAVYAPLNMLAEKQSEAGHGLSGLGFGIQMMGRTFAWGLAGISMGLGQGIALRSKRLILYGLIGGIIGGLLGGLFFDPVDLILLGNDKPSAWVSRLVGIGLIGLSVGGMIGVVELLARDAWLRMTQGPLRGKEFLIFKDIMQVGSSPRSDLYLFNDAAVAEQHAVLRAIGDDCEIEARHSATHPVLINGRAVTRARLKHGDDVTIGGTMFIFQKRKT